MKKRVLFVDDEPRILDGLQRMLRPFRDEWEMSFATSGDEALNYMASNSVDIIVSDMRMPGMDGAELLNRVKAESPNTIRFALSGQSDQETWVRAVGSAHQFLSKPCSPERLRSSISEACILRERLQSQALRNLVSSIGSLPTPPKIYHEIMALMENQGVSVTEIGHAIEQDLAMSAKVLQLVNSAYFGMHTHVADAAQAVTLLGLGTLRALVLMIRVFEEASGSGACLEFIENLRQHCIGVSKLSSHLVHLETQDKNLIQEAAVAGMLHDIGRLVFASSFSKQYAGLLKVYSAESPELIDAETKEFGASHEDVGAYLLALWGLSDQVVQAVAYHHNPSASLNSFLSPLSIVHVADALLLSSNADGGSLEKPAIDMEYIARLKLLERLKVWKAVAAKPESHAL